MNPSLLPVLPLLLVACGGDTGFQQAKTDNGGEQGTGVLEISATSLDFADLDWEQGIASSQTIEVRNVGEDNVLKIYEWGLTDSGGGVFYTEDLDSLELSPGAERELIVVATLAEFAAVTGSARVRTNDPDASNVTITLTAEPAGWTGEPADTSEPGDTAD